MRARRAAGSGARAARWRLPCTWSTTWTVSAGQGRRRGRDGERGGGGGIGAGAAAAAERELKLRHGQRGGVGGAARWVRHPLAPGYVSSVRWGVGVKPWRLWGSAGQRSCSCPFPLLWIPLPSPPCARRPAPVPFLCSRPRCPLGWAVVPAQHPGGCSRPAEVSGRLTVRDSQDEFGLVGLVYNSSRSSPCRGQGHFPLARLLRVLSSVFIVGIENLPCELQRNFQLMRELDQRTEGTCRCSGRQSRESPAWRTGRAPWRPGFRGRGCSFSQAECSAVFPPFL